jgi:hypothetical protein
MELFITKNISRNTWLLCLLSIFFGIYYTVLGPRWLCIVGIIGPLILTYGQRRISADPLEVGLLTFWGRRLPVIITEGDKLLPTIFPFLIDVIKIGVVRMTFEYRFDVIARNKVEKDDGTAEFSVAGKLCVEISVVCQPDYQAKNAGYRMMRFLISGRRAGVEAMLEQVIVTYTRYIGLTHSWTEFMSLKSPLAAALIMRIADSKFRRLPRGEDGNILESAFAFSGDAYAQLPPESDPFQYLLDAGGVGTQEYKNRYQEIEHFLRVALKNGGGDVLDIGLLIQRINVESIEPTGKLAAAADEPAVEDIQRISDEKDFKTGLILAQRYIDAGKENGETILLTQAMEAVRIDRKRATETIVRSSGNPIVDAAALVGIRK